MSVITSVLIGIAARSASELMPAAANNVFINGAKITSSDINATNGIVHVIDRVLAPPIVNTVTMLAANPDFKLLMQGVAKGALATAFTGTAAAPVTIFAPNNAAMIAAGYDSTTIANLAGATLTTFQNTLRYHLVPGRNFLGNLKDGPLKTVFGTNITLSAGVTKVAGVNNTTPVSFILPNLLTTTGVIHTINGVLKP